MSTSSVSLTQTTPSYAPVCPGDELIFTCIVFGTNLNQAIVVLVWQGDKEARSLGPSGTTSGTIDSFMVKIDKSNATTVISSATNNFAPVELDGANISCIRAISNGAKVTLTIDIAGNHAGIILSFLCIINFLFLLQTHQYQLIISLLIHLIMIQY